MRYPNRIHELRSEKGLSLEQVAEIAGTSNQMLSKLERGESKLTDQWMRRIAPALDVQPWELLGDWSGQNGRSISAPPGLLVALDAPGIVEIGGVEFASIGRYDAGFSAGPGSLLEHDPEPLGYHLIEAQWLRAVSASRPEHLAVVRVDGDSMVPTLNGGDWVLVDRNQRRVSREGIYALHVYESAWVKRLTLNLREKLIRIISDNPAYPMQELPEHEVQLIGKVLSIVARQLP